MRRRVSTKLAGLIFLLACTLVSSSSYAQYLASIGPAKCCQSHCHRGKATASADADRCCRTHLSVLPAGLGPAAADAHQVVAVAVALGCGLQTVSALPTCFVPAPSVRLRGSPPGSLLAAHTSHLV